MKYTKIIFCALVILPWSVSPSVAEERGREGRGEHERVVVRGGGHGPGWRGEIGRFHEHDIELWRGGRWSRGLHGGRMGWWWVVAGAWYFYPSPVYPYPDPYQPPVVLQQQATPPSPQYWYYCADPAGYYPYVAECHVNWQQVAASPPPAQGAYQTSPPPNQGAYPAPPR